MAKLTVGLEVSPGSVRAATLRVGKHGPILEAMAEVPLQPGIITPNGVAEPDGLTAAIKHMWSTYKIAKRKVILGVGGQRVVVRTARVPWVPAKELKSALPLYVGEIVPFDPAEAVVDYVISGEAMGEEGAREYTGVLVAAAEDFVVGLVDAVQAARVTVTSVDLNAFAILRALVPPVQEGFTVTEALASVGSQSSQVIVHTNGRPELVRDLAMGSDSVIEAYQLLDPTVPTSSIQALEPLVEDIASTVGFYQASDGSRPLSRLTLTGDGSVLPGIEYMLASAVQVPVVRDAAWLSMPRGGDLDDEVVMMNASRMAAPVGLAMDAIT